MIRFHQLQASCNARRPINKLPIEILTQIVAEALAESLDDPYLLRALFTRVQLHRRPLDGDK